MQNQDEYPEIKLPHEMTDAELIQHEADVAAAGERLFAGIEATAPDDGLDDEPEDENGDLLETLVGDHRSMEEYLDDELDDD